MAVHQSNDGRWDSGQIYVWLLGPAIGSNHQPKTFREPKRQIRRPDRILMRNLSALR